MARVWGRMPSRMLLENHSSLVLLRAKPQTSRDTTVTRLVRTV